MNKTLLTINYSALQIIAISKRGSVLVRDVEHLQEYWVLRRVFMRLINLKQLDGVITLVPNMSEIGKPDFKTLMVLSPF